MKSIDSFQFSLGLCLFVLFFARRFFARFNTIVKKPFRKLHSNFLNFKISSISVKMFRFSIRLKRQKKNLVKLQHRKNQNKFNDFKRALVAIWAQDVFGKRKGFIFAMQSVHIDAFCQNFILNEQQLTYFLTMLTI